MASVFKLHCEALGGSTAAANVYRYLAVLLGPILCVIFIAVGFPKSVIEDQVSELWVPKSSDFAKESQYKDDNGMGSTSTQFLVTGRPRDGTSNVLTADMLLEHAARIDKIYATTVTVDGMKFTLDDICQNPAGAYVMPCLKISIVDCFFEGETAMSVQGVATWRAQALAQTMTTPGVVPTSGDEYTGYLSVGLAGSYCASGTPYVNPADGTTVSSTCSASSMAAGEAADAACMGCIGSYMSTLPASAQDAIVLGVVTQGVELQLSALTPYTAKPRLQGAAAKLSDAEVRATVTAPCQQWEAGALFGDINKLLVLGHRKEDADGALTRAGAFEAVFPLNAGAAIRSRVAGDGSGDSTPETVKYSARGKGVSITPEQAEAVLREMKIALEATATQGWDDIIYQAGTSNLVHTAFTDDSVVHGTFANVLIDNTTKSSSLMVANYVIVIVLAALAFANCTNLVKSRSTMGFFGVCFAIAGFLAALGFAAMIDIKWNVITLWTLPFLMVGIGVDDMFIIQLAVDNRWKKGKDPKDVLGEALADVIAPVTLTSIVNFFMFMVMARSDLSGIYDTAYVAMIAIVILWLMMITTFPALVAIDLSRQAANRSEICCLCTTTVSPTTDDAEKSGDGNESEWAMTQFISKHIDDKLYVPAITSRVGQAVVGILSVVAAVVCGAKMGSLPLGLELNDFFVTDTVQALYFLDRTEYFPFWPINMNFGDVAYHTAPAQLGMIKYWENVMAMPQVSGPSTSGFVWTAAMAAWASPDICNAATNPLISACGPDVNPVCTAKWYPNIYKSKLSSDGGVCADFSQHPSVGAFGGDMYTALNFKHLLLTSAISDDAADAAVAMDPLFGPLLAQAVQATTCAADDSTDCVTNALSVMPDAMKAPTVRQTYAIALRGDALYAPMLDAALAASPGCATLCTDADACAGCLAQTKAAMSDAEKDAAAKAAYAGLPANHPANLVGYAPSGYSEFCPVLDLAQADFDMCLDLWRQNDATYSLLSPGIKLDGAASVAPVKYSQVGGASTYAIKLVTTEDYLDMIRASREFCDTAETLAPAQPDGPYDEELQQLHCFMSGIPFDYWEQYLSIEDFLFETIGLACLAATAVAFAFLALELGLSGRTTPLKAAQSALVGAIIIAFIIAISVVTVVGFIGWMEVPLSGLTAMSSLMTVGFATEFAVHITHGFMVAPDDTGASRAKTTMDVLFLPTLLAFISSLAGILLLLASDFGFVTNYVFKPLITCIVVTYLYGVWTLPVLLQCLHCVLPRLDAAEAPAPESAPEASPDVETAPMIEEAVKAEDVEVNEVDTQRDGVTAGLPDRATK